MLEGIAKKLAAAVLAGVSVPDVESFNDPFALEVPWRPLPGSSSRLRSHHLTDDGSGKLEFTRPASAYLIAALIAGACLGFPIFTLIKSGHASLCSAPFALIGLIFVWPKKRAFELNTQTIILGSKRFPFSAVHALQLLRHEHTGSEDSAGYTTYQLNLVMKDRTRVNVVDHGNLDAGRSDAQRLAQHLRVKLWDGPGAPQITGEQAIKLMTAEERPPALR